MPRIFFFLRQAGKAGIFYSADKCFETGADPRNIFDKQIKKIWTPCLSAFGVEFESLRYREIFEISARADKKL